MRPKVTQVLPYDTYLTMIEASVGSAMFRTSWANIDGQRKDLLEGGELSCAFYVSNMLMMFKLLESVHSTVSGLMRDLERSGWHKADSLRPGCVLVWEKARQAHAQEHLHAGFYIGNDRAISHSDKERAPVEHDWQFGPSLDGAPVRKIIASYTHDFLAQ